MKNILSMAAVALFMMTSCSSDDNANVTPPQDNTLLKKTISTSQTGIPNTTFYTYDGNKLVSMLDENGMGTQFTYTGNLITYAKSISSNSVNERTYVYNSDNQKTSEIEYYKFNIGNEVHEQWTKNIFNYNNDGSVTVDTYTGEEENVWTFFNTNTISYTENTINYQSVTATYDIKNSPMKNVLGYKEYMMPYNFLRNTLTMVIDGTESAATYSYTYNDNDYPISLSTLVHFEGQSPTTSTTEYLYE